VVECYYPDGRAFRHEIGDVSCGIYRSKSTNGELGNCAPWRVVSRASDAKPDSDRLHFDDLTAITAPFGMLDDDTQQRLKDYRYAVQRFDGHEWVDCGFNCDWAATVYRANSMQAKARAAIARAKGGDA
jgi:hypothetical protein